MQLADILNSVTESYIKRLEETVKKALREEWRAITETSLQEKYLSPEETCNLFKPKLTKPTLESYAKKGLLRKHYLGGRTWFKYAEILEAINKVEYFSNSTKEITRVNRRERRKKPVENLDDSYIKSKLISKGLSKDLVNEQPEIITLQRSTLQLKREIKSNEA